MKTYTIVGGVNGVGKSSLSGVLKTQLTDLGVIIDVDKMTAEMGVTPLEGGKAAVERIRQCMAKGVCFTQETTLSGRRIEKTVQTAREAGYYIRLFYVGLDTVEESLKRIANRVAKGGHNIASDDVRRRFAERFGSLAAVLPYCDEATFYDNDNGFEEVAEYRNGELIPKGTKKPRWLEELKQSL